MLIDMLLLFAVHCLADYPLQGEYLERNKRKSLYLLTCHCVLYSSIVWIGYCLITGSNYQAYFSKVIFLIIFISHILIDFGKCYAMNSLILERINGMIDNEKFRRLEATLNKFDQLFHIIILFIIYFCKY